MASATDPSQPQPLLALARGRFSQLSFLCVSPGQPTIAQPMAKALWVLSGVVGKLGRERSLWGCLLQGGQLAVPGVDQRSW